MGSCHVEVGRHNSVTQTLHDGRGSLGVSIWEGEMGREEDVNECGKALTKFGEIGSSSKRGNYRESA